MGKVRVRGFAVSIDGWFALTVGVSPGAGGSLPKDRDNR